MNEAIDRRARPATTTAADLRSLLERTSRSPVRPSAAMLSLSPRLQREPSCTREWMCKFIDKARERAPKRANDDRETKKRHSTISRHRLGDTPFLPSPAQAVFRPWIHLSDTPAARDDQGAARPGFAIQVRRRPIKRFFLFGRASFFFARNRSRYFSLSSSSTTTTLTTSAPLSTPLHHHRNHQTPKQRASKRVKVVREIIREVAGLAPYERRIGELLKTGREKRALRFSKKKLGTHSRGKAKREEVADMLRKKK